MRVVSIRLEEGLYRQLHRRACAANLSISSFLKPVIEDAAVPGSRYVYTGHDEIISIAIQIFTIVTGMAGDLNPETLKTAMAQARELLRERALLGEEQGT